MAGCVVAAFGLLPDGCGHRLTWMMLDPSSQGAGIGSTIMGRIISGRSESRPSTIKIAASHKSALFFAKFGAVATARTENGWGPGMDRVDMELEL